MSDTGDRLAVRYGRWAVIAGASDGVGAAAAHRLAASGIDLVLLARRRPVLDELAAELAQQHGVEVRTLAVDLAGADAAQRVIDTTAGLEVGFLLYCAGADSNFAPFLDLPIDVATQLVHRNCIVPMQLAHHFGAEMAARGRGCLAFLSSGAAMAGAPNMVAYGASKAFDIVMAEALWAELSPKGVDVVVLVLGATDTPAFRDLMHRRGVIPSVDVPPPVPGLTTVEAVADRLFAHLTDGPTVYATDDMAAAATFMGSLPRNEAVRIMVQNAGATMGD